MSKIKELSDADLKHEILFAKYHIAMGKNVFTIKQNKKYLKRLETEQLRRLYGEKSNFR